MTDAALRLGANAVVALRFDTAPLGDLTEINAYGTAVVTIDTKDAKKGGKGGEGNDNNNNGKKGNVSPAWSQSWYYHGLCSRSGRRIR